MLKPLMILYCFLLLGPGVWAQTKAEMWIAQLVEDLNQAIIDQDSRILDQLTANRLSYGHSSGVIQDKAAFIEGVMQGPNRFQAIACHHQEIRVSGSNAVVRHIAIAQVINQGKEIEIQYGNLLIWQKKHGAWKLLARQGYKL